MIKHTAYQSLEAVAKVADPEQRKEALRQLLVNTNPLAVILQYTYHPDVKFDLPSGPLPDTIAKKSRHDEAGVLFANVKRLYQFKDDFQMNKHRREENFISMYEAVASDDADLLIAVKDKKLPWPSLDAEFVVSAVPELFPTGYVPPKSEEVSTDEVTTDEGTFQTEPAKQVAAGPSKAEIARGIINNNPNLTRKETIQMMVATGIKANVASKYYQKFKVQ